MWLISGEETYEKTEENFHKAIDVILAHGEDPSAVRLAWFEGFGSELHMIYIYYIIINHISLHRT